MTPTHDNFVPIMFMGLGLSFAIIVLIALGIDLNDLRMLLLPTWGMK